MSEAKSSWLDVWISRHDSHNNSSIAAPSNEESIERLTNQLNDLKNQLKPAAIQCAEAINAHYKRNESNQTTNAAYELRRARAACNAYESLGATQQTRKRRGGYSQCVANNSGVNQFVNRSALKLASIDALLGFELVKSCRRPSTKLDEQPLPHAAHGADNHFAFVDLCGAPGGFSEYILYRNEHPVNNDSTVNKDNAIASNPASSPERSCLGFGMSLLGSNEDGKGASWDLSHLQRYRQRIKKKKAEQANNQLNASDEDSETKQHLHYSICNGSDGTGSIYNWDNVLHLQYEVTSTLQKKLRGEVSTGLVHLVVADGGFDAQRDSSSQEEVTYRIVVSQTAAALQLLHPGGNFVVKMFGFQLVGTKKMLRYLYEQFEKIGFVKPIVSRPASAERYLVCLGYDGCGESWDGVRWSHEMMEGNDDLGIHIDDKLTRLNDALRSFDVKLLQLNVESCQSIVDLLNERKLIAARAEASFCEKKREKIDLILYEKSWQLV